MCINMYIFSLFRRLSLRVRSGVAGLVFAFQCMRCGIKVWVAGGDSSIAEGRRWRKPYTYMYIQNTTYTEIYAKEIATSSFLKPQSH